VGKAGSEAVWSSRFSHNWEESDWRMGILEEENKVRISSHK